MPSTILVLDAGLAMEMMKQGAMLTVLSTLIAAFAMPAALVSAADIIDSKWAVAIDRLVFTLLAWEI